MKLSAIGVDVGGTKIAAAAVTPRGEFISEVHEVPTPQSPNPDGVISEIVSLVRRISAPLLVQGIGVATPGPYTNPNNPQDVESVLPFESMSVHAGNIQGLSRGVVLGALLETRIGKPVALENDANVYVLGEQRWGAARGHANVIGFIQSSGVGGGVMVDGRLLHGFNGNAGEWGHLTVEEDSRLALECSEKIPARGHLEAQISGPKLKEYFGVSPEDAEPETRARMIARSVHYAGPQLANLAQSIGATRIVLCGGVGVGFGDLYANSLQAHIESRSTTFRADRGCHVVTAELEGRAPILGAAAVAFEKLGIEMEDRRLPAPDLERKYPLPG